MPEATELRRTVLQVVSDLEREDRSLQTVSVLREALDRLGGHRSHELEQALLTVWHDLFRTGLLAWGHNLSNPEPPFCHPTDRGRRALSELSRDPHNPDGYLKELEPSISRFPIAKSYITEAVGAFVSDLHRAAAVLAGAASESLVLSVRDVLVKSFTEKGNTPPPSLDDRSIKTVRDKVDQVIVSRIGDMPRQLQERYEAFFVRVSDQLRIARNDAGHPASIEPISEPVVHSNLLAFPAFVHLVAEVCDWIPEAF